MGDAEGVACCGCVAALAATRTRATPESAGNSGGAGIDVRGDDERQFSVQKKQKLLIEKAKKKNIFIVVSTTWYVRRVCTTTGRICCGLRAVRRPVACRERHGGSEP